MTDETMEQIKRDAHVHAQRYPTKYEIRFITYSIGATHQHPISHAQGVKEGRRQAIEESLRESLGKISKNYDSYETIH